MTKEKKIMEKKTIYDFISDSLVTGSLLKGFTIPYSIHIVH